jgi:hypothetical protein
MDTEEAAILVIDDLIQKMNEVNAAVNQEFDRSISKQSRGRIKYGANVQHVSTVNAFRIIQKNLLNELAKRRMMA